jgi:hypothetical protein
MTVDGDRDVTSHQARTRLRPTSKTTAASAFFLVAFTFVFGKTHFITKARAIHLPALAKGTVFAVNNLATLPCQTS